MLILKHLKPVELTSKSTSIKKDKVKKIIKPAIGVTATVVALLCALFYNENQYNALPDNNNAEPALRPEPFPINNQGFAYDRNGMIEQREQNLDYRYFFDDDFPEEINDRYFHPQNIANNHQINILIAGECAAREYDNVKRQFINETIPPDMPQILAPIRENSEHLFNNNEMYHFNSYIFPSVNEMDYTNNVNDEYEVRIIFFDASNPNPEMLNHAKMIFNPYRHRIPIRKIVPIIDLNNIEVCQNNILKIQRDFCNLSWSLTNTRVRKAQDFNEYECGHFSQEDIDTLKNEIIELCL